MLPEAVGETGESEDWERGFVSWYVLGGVVLGAWGVDLVLWVWELRTIVKVVAGRLLMFVLCPLGGLVVDVAVLICLRFER